MDENYCTRHDRFHHRDGSCPECENNFESQTFAEQTIGFAQRLNDRLEVLEAEVKRLKRELNLK